MSREARSTCPIAKTLDIVGDRWTLLLLRDLLLGKTRFSEFRESPEKIATNILSNRLRLLEDAELVTKRPYQTRPKRFEYRLTEKGAALHPMLQEMCLWANRHIPGTRTPPDDFMHRQSA